MAKVPARYIGGHEIVLATFGRPYFDAQGNLLSSLVLRPGDTLMVEQQEVQGMTYKFDPHGILDPLFLGHGRVILTEDTGKNDEELFALGYQFHAGRTDFEEIKASASAAIGVRGRAAAKEQE